MAGNSEINDEQKISALIVSLNQLAAEMKETRKVIEKLAAVHGLEWSQDLKDWVSKEKLDELRKNPRNGHY